MIRAAECVLPCAELGATLDFFVGRLGFRVASIFPADDPRVAVVEGHGLRLRLERGGAGAPGAIRLLCDDPAALAGGATTLTAPNGTRVELAAAAPAVAVPPLAPALVVARAGDEAAWHEGRAGMGYRDLIPGRLGGRFVASHIRIVTGGAVPDYVHFHEVRFQMIFCRRGWVRVVYEDQGADFVMRAGDCVLQPPRIRHRVLEASAGLEVVEIGCPAEHPTVADPALELPGGAPRPARAFDGQRFVRHEAARARWAPSGLAGFAASDTGIAAATGGLAGARVLRPEASRPGDGSFLAAAEFHFLFALEGAVAVDAGGAGVHRLGPADGVALPPGARVALREPGADLALLEVTLPARPEAQ